MTHRGKLNFLITILLAVFVLTGVYIFTIGYRKYSLKNENIYKTRELALKVIEDKNFYKHTKTVKKLIDETEECYLLFYSPETASVGVRAYKIEEITNKFLFFEKSGFHLSSTTDVALDENQGMSVVAFDNLLISVEVGDNKPNYLNVIRDYFLKKYDISTIVTKTYDNRDKIILKSEKGKELEFDFQIENKKYKEKNVKFIFSKLH